MGNALEPVHLTHDDTHPPGPGTGPRSTSTLILLNKRDVKTLGI